MSYRTKSMFVALVALLGFFGFLIMMKHALEIDNSPERQSNFETMSQRKVDKLFYEELRAIRKALENLKDD